MQLSYDVVSHNGGWVIIVTPERTHAFASKVDAYYAAVEFARELKHEGGHLVHVHVHHEQFQLPFAQAC
jgi:hypothetical protein